MPQNPLGDRELPALTLPGTAVPLSLLDLAIITPGETVAQSLAGSVALAQTAEIHGYRRVWYAEHHNMASIASSAPAVLIAHIATQTRTIRLGAGGIMLPNHAPLTIAEQFGMLEALHPGRIDLGLGRAPGTDPTTTRALRRNHTSSDSFPEDVLELQAFLSEDSRIPNVEATPGKGANVPLYILGSSTFGAELAAQYGLPFAFASHFAPHALHEAIARYRGGYRPSERHPEPYVFAAVNVVAADTTEAARAHFHASQRMMVKVLVGRGLSLSDDDADAILESPGGAQIRQMGKYTAVGTGPEVQSYLEDFASKTGANELILSFRVPPLAARLHAVALVADRCRAAASHAA